MGCRISKKNQQTQTEPRQKIINDYIKTTVNFRNSNGGNCDLNVQLKKQRLEFICVGAFLQLNNLKDKFKIISIDQKIGNLNYRPDLLIQNKKTNEIIHVEIDENGHNNYNKEGGW